MSHDQCVFKDCKKPQTKYGACDGHQDMAHAVMRGAPVTCMHGVALDKDCFDCASSAARRRATDAVVVDAARRGRVTDAMKSIDLNPGRLPGQLREDPRGEDGEGVS